jgi:methylated-DNA-[protein]-cysteine S-methyltransferase
MKQYAHTESPLGRILLVADDALCALYFEGQKHEQRPGAGWVEAPDRPLFDRARKQLAEYFAGKRDRFDLPLAPQGTEFQHRVWKALRAIPAGETVTYGSIARSIGAADSVRAAAAAIGRNPLSIVVPCHRVIGSDGSLTGYAGGLERKRALLALEARAQAFTLA